MIDWMDCALEEAQKAQKNGNVPIGAVIVRGNALVAAVGNRMYQEKDPLAHAELIALQQAVKILGTTYLDDCDLYVTLEPCTMCAGAISLARIRRLYFGAYDSKGGGVEHGARVFNHSTCHHRPEIFGGIKEQACQALLQNFFRIHCRAP